MGKHRLVPVEPTQEMINAALKSDHAEISPRKIVEQDYKAMLAAAPAVQVEPIGWYTEDHFDDKSATTYSAEVAQRWRDKGWPVWSLYTAPQPTESEILSSYPVSGQIFFRGSSNEWVLELTGSVNGTTFTARQLEVLLVSGHLPRPWKERLSILLAAHRKQGGGQA